MYLNRLRNFSVLLKHPLKNIQYCRNIGTKSGNKCILPSPFPAGTRSKLVKNSATDFQPTDNGQPQQNLSSKVDDVELRINEYLSHEMNSSYQYFSMANFFTSQQFLQGFAAMYLARSTEMRSNALNLMGYQNLRGRKAFITDAKKPENSWKDVKHSLEFAIDLETENSKFLNSIHGIAQENSDHLTTTFITQEFLCKPICHTHFYNQLLSRLQSDGSALTIYLVDKELKEQFAYNNDEFVKLSGKFSPNNSTYWWEL